MEVLRRFAQRMEDIVLKAKAIPEIGFLSCLNHLQSRMDFFVGFLCNVNLLRILHSGISYIALAAAKSLPASFLISLTTVIKVFWIVVWSA